jgi:hypothetical protein
MVKLPEEQFELKERSGAAGVLAKEYCRTSLRINELKLD